MARKPNILAPTRLEISLPEDVRAQLDLYLYSDIEGCVPRGAYSALIEQLLREYFNRRLHGSSFT